MRLKHLSYISGTGKALLGKTIGDVLRETAKKHPSADACVFRHEGVKWSYLELLQRSEEVANGFLWLGLKKQSRVGIFAPDCKEWVLTLFGTALSGMILVNINPAYHRHELLHALTDVGCSALVTSSGFRNTDYLQMINEICPEIASSKSGALESKTIPSLKTVIKIEDAPTPGMLNFKDLYGRKVNDFSEVTSSLSFEDPVNIQFTSGTTGKSKDVVLTHHSLVNNAHYFGDLMKYHSDERICVQVPLYHCFGMVLGPITAIAYGSAIVIADSGFNVAATLSAIEEEKCTTIYGVPTMFQAMLTEQSKHPHILTSLEKGVIGGSVATSELMKRLINELGIKHMVNEYGMTEASGVITMTKYEGKFAKQISSVGIPLPNTEIKIVDEKNATVPQGETGEICLRGYLVMKEYWSNEEGTRQTIDSNGWLHTGDLGLLDQDMYLKIVGRMKDVINRGGEKLLSSEVESFYHTHPDIEELHVIGVPDGYYGEAVCAWVKMKPGRTPVTVADLRKFGEAEIAHFKIPSIVHIVDSFPQNSVGKVMKRAMREEETKKRSQVVNQSAQ